MEAYFAAKRRLFEMLPRRRARRDQHGRSARARPWSRSASRPVTYAINASRRRHARTDRDDAVGLALRRQDAEGHRAHHVEAGRPAERLQHPRRHRDGRVARRSDRRDRSAASPTLSGVPGRFEVVSQAGDDVTVVVDYAHTDDALRNLLETARPLSAKRLITVFGCGGDRDRSKRPLMGMVAARLSDVVVITSDNPRSEDPARIIEEIERGIPAGSQASSRAPVVESVVDRAAAIERAVSMASRRRRGADRRQGPREVSADRRSGVAVRRRRSGAGGAGEARAKPRRRRRRRRVDARTNTAGRGNDRRGDERPAGRPAMTTAT